MFIFWDPKLPFQNAVTLDVLEPCHMAGRHYDLLLSCQESVVLTLPSASMSWWLLTLSGPQGIGSDFRFRGAGLGLGRGTHFYGS